MLWCAKDPKGRMVEKTIAQYKDECVYALFDCMSREFQHEHWKNISTSRKAYEKLGYRFVKVELKEITR